METTDHSLRAKFAEKLISGVAVGALLGAFGASGFVVLKGAEQLFRHRANAWSWLKGENSNPTPAPTAPAQLSDQQIFERKLECGKLLSKVEGSLFGPEPHMQKGVLVLNPVIVYSPRLNTCVLIHEFVLHGRMVVPPYREYHTEHASLEDLLTGQTVEDHEFDLDVPEEADLAKNFEQDAVGRYGQAVPN